MGNESLMERVVLVEIQNLALSCIKLQRNA